MTGTFSCIEPPQETHVINISGEWRIIYEDNFNISRMDYNDSDASVINLPGNWTQTLQNYKSMAAVIWLRKRVIINDSFSDSELVLELGKIGVADEVYFNGCFIGSTGGIPKGDKTIDYRFAWKTPRQYLIPKFLIRYNQPNIISVRVFSHIISGVNGNLRIREFWYNYPYQVQYFIPVLINYFSIIINAIFFFLFSVQYLYDKARLIFLYLALTAISGIVLNLCVMDVPFYINGMIRFRILFIAYSSISVFIALLMQEIFNRRYAYSTLVLLSAFIIITVCILLPQSTRTYIVYTRVAVTLFVFTCQFYAVISSVISITGNLCKYWIFLFTVPVILSLIRNAYYLTIMDYDAIYLTIFLHAPIIITISILFILFDYETQKRNNETIFQSLKKKAQRLQHDLSRSKKTNAKLQPNEIIHNLIDYIDMNYTETYNRSGLAKLFGLNENYMLQIFKKTTGKTISNYINTKRIEKAIEMLNEEDVKIIDIAYNIGFENYNHFFNCFKKATMMSPEQFRKTLINK